MRVMNSLGGGLAVGDYPWSFVESWNCLGCGHICCMHATVPLTVKEWLNLVQHYGYGVVEDDIRGFYLKADPSRKCVFGHPSEGYWFCSIQKIKPKACKLWPFKVYRTPKHGWAREAAYEFGEDRFYIYADSHCEGLRWGRPNREMVRKVLPEIMHIALGTQYTQNYSTSELLPRLKPRI